MKQTLHILNGQCMYDAFMENKVLSEEIIPFNEAMCQGELIEDIFSPLFCERRCALHHVGPAQYGEITLVPLQVLQQHRFDRIELWFDEDMFCQINVLVLLAYLEQIKCRSRVILNIVDDSYHIMHQHELVLGMYHQVYKEVLLYKKESSIDLIQPLKQGVEYYLSLQQEDNPIAQYISRSSKVEEEELVWQLVEKFRSTYGLGDVQCRALIKEVRNIE